VTAPAESLLLTVEEAAEQLRTSARTVQRHIADGRIKTTDVGTRKKPILRVARTELIAFIKRQAIR
jgi:excisionase family DNA binding protein